uniref:Uncharacterized protein n=1 Tax=Trichuris muris TaxID=70415 RepID=A0A5S6Q779_TRIMR
MDDLRRVRIDHRTQVKQPKRVEMNQLPNKLATGFTLGFPVQFERRYIRMIRSHLSEGNYFPFFEQPFAVLPAQETIHAKVYDWRLTSTAYCASEA